MSAITRLECKKIFTKNNLLIAYLFLLICLAKMLPYGQSLDMVLDEKNFGSGLFYWALLKKEGIKYDGFLTKNQIKKVRSLYRQSKEKDFIEGRRSGEKDLGLESVHPFQWPAESLNFPTSNGIQDFSIQVSNQEIGGFYQDRLEAINTWIHRSDHAYNQTRVRSILHQARQVKRFFYYAYNKGWRYMRGFLHMTFYLFLIYLVLALSALASPGNRQGFTEMDLYTKKGRFSPCLAKLRAGEIFASLTYLAYLSFLLVYHWMIYSLHGANASIEFYSNSAIFNLTACQGFFLETLSGYSASLVMVDVILSVSMFFYNTRVSLVPLILILIYLNKRAASPQPWASTLALFMPQNFVRYNLSPSKLLVLKNHVFPYTLTTFLLSLVYISISRIFAIPFTNHYYLKGGKGK